MAAADAIVRARVDAWLALAKQQSFGGDRSAAGRYAAEQRWKGHVKRGSEGRTVDQKVSEGPVGLKFGWDANGLPVVGSTEQIMDRLGLKVRYRTDKAGVRHPKGLDTSYFMREYGLKVTVTGSALKADLSGDEDAKLGVVAASLQAVDDVLSIMDSDDRPKDLVIKVTGGSENGRARGEVTGDGKTMTIYVRPILNSSVDLAFMLLGKDGGEEQKQRQVGRRFTAEDPRFLADNNNSISGLAARQGYATTVHEFGHVIDSLSQGASQHSTYWMSSRDKAWHSDGLKSPALASPGWRTEKLPSGATYGQATRGTMVSQYQNQNRHERYAESFAAWFLFSRATGGALARTDNGDGSGTINDRNRLAATQLLQYRSFIKQSSVETPVDLPWNHPIMLFTVAPYANDAELLKVKSFGGDRSAAGRYAAEQRWKGHVKQERSRKKRKNTVDGDRATRIRELAYEAAILRLKAESTRPPTWVVAGVFGNSGHSIQDVDLPDDNKSLIPVPEITSEEIEVARKLEEIGAKLLAEADAILVERGDWTAEQIAESDRMARTHSDLMGSAHRQIDEVMAGERDFIQIGDRIIPISEGLQWALANVRQISEEVRSFGGDVAMQDEILKDRLFPAILSARTHGMHELLGEVEAAVLREVGNYYHEASDLQQSRFRVFQEMLGGADSFGPDDYVWDNGLRGEKVSMQDREYLRGGTLDYDKEQIGGGGANFGLHGKTQAMRALPTKALRKLNGVSFSLRQATTGISDYEGYYSPSEKMIVVSGDALYKSSHIVDVASAATHEIVHAITYHDPGSRALENFYRAYRAQGAQGSPHWSISAGNGTINPFYASLPDAFVDSYAGRVYMQRTDTGRRARFTATEVLSVGSEYVTGLGRGRYGMDLGLAAFTAGWMASFVKMPDVAKSLIGNLMTEMRIFAKAQSFGGDRSAAGRYAAEQRWKGHVKQGTSSGKGGIRTNYGTQTAERLRRHLKMAEEQHRRALAVGDKQKADMWGRAADAVRERMREMLPERLDWQEARRRVMEKVRSFGGDRSAAGRYAAEQRWKGHVKQEGGRRSSMPVDELLEIMYTQASPEDALRVIAERLGKSPRPAIADIPDDEINGLRGVSARGARRLVEGSITHRQFPTWGQGLYFFPLDPSNARNVADTTENALYYGDNVVGLKIGDEAKMIQGEDAWREADAGLDLRWTGKGWESSVVDLSRVPDNYIISDFYNLYWASQGYDGFHTGIEIVMFNFEHVTVRRADVERFKVGKAQSFGGDRSAAGRYAAEQRWKGHVKQGDDLGPRTVKQIVAEGPRVALFGVDAMGMPVMGSLKELRERYGKTAEERQAYFRETYGIDLIVQKTTQYSVQEATTLGALQALEEMMLNTNDGQRLLGQVKIGYDGNDDQYVQADATKASGFIDVSTGDITVMLGKEQAGGKELIEIAKRMMAREGVQDGPVSAETVVQAGRSLYNIARHFAVAGLEGRAVESLGTGKDAIRVLSQRIGYAVIVHEFGHSIDYRFAPGFDGVQFAALRNTDAVLHSREWDDFKQGPSLYARQQWLDESETIAESFAAWFLYGRPAAGKPARLEGHVAEASNILAPILRAAEGVMKSKVITFSISEAPLDHPVVEFVVAPLLYGQSDSELLKARVRMQMLEIMWKRQSFGGDRSAAGRYAAEQRWRGHKKSESKSQKPRKLSQTEMAGVHENMMQQQEENVDKAGISNQARKAYQLYPTSAHAAMNQVLRGQEVTGMWISETIRPDVAAKALKDAFDEISVTTPETLTVYRGVPHGEDVFGIIESGTEFEDGGLISTSLSADFARDFSDGNVGVDTVFIITIPKGTKVLVPRGPYWERERELVLRPNTKFKVTEVIYSGDENNRRAEIICEVVNG